MKDKVEIRAGVTITREEYEQLHEAFNQPDPPKFERWKPEDSVASDMPIFATITELDAFIKIASPEIEFYWTGKRPEGYDASS